MEVRELDFDDPCFECIIRVCCTKSCDKAINFFVYKEFKIFQDEMRREEEYISTEGISIEYNEQKIRRRK